MCIFMSIVNNVLLLFLVYIFKKLINDFGYHQVCKRVNWNHTFPFRIPLSVFCENGVCMLTLNQKKLYSFSCGASGTQTSVNFDNIINVHALNYICKRKDKLVFLIQIKNLSIMPKLTKLRNQTRCEIQKLLSKKKELNRLRFLVNNEIKKCKKKS